MTIVERSMVDATAAGRTEDEGWADGMGTVRLIGANTRFFTDSSQVVPGTISSGDAAAGLTIDFYGRTQVEAVGEARMGYVEPKNATAINPDPIAMVAGAEHRDLAKQFIEFVLSTQGQYLWNTRAGAPGGPRLTSLRRLPIRPDVYNNPDSTDHVNPFLTVGGFNKSNAREKTNSILGELVAASCINLLTELRQTRAAILRSDEPEVLTAKLGHFPFDQKEALRRGETYKNASALDRVHLLAQWTDEFRQEYRALREEASRTHAAIGSH